MKLNDKTEIKLNSFLPNYNSELVNTDPEFYELFNNFTFGEVISESKLSDRTIFLVILSSLITNQSLNQYRIYVEGAIDNGISPVEIKEVLYQSVAYLGISKVSDFIDETNYLFDEKGISIPQPGQSVTNSKNRYDAGLNKQIEIFGEEMINQLNESVPDNQKHFNDFLASYCFGDYYTRGGLDNNDREIITFAILASLRGCENQLRGHIIGNFNVGNDVEMLINVITILLPYNGFPRTLNALNILNEIINGDD